MAIDPSELSTETLAVLTELAEESSKSGKDLATTLRETVDALKSRPQPEESWLDTEYMDSCAAQVQKHVSVERMREILSKVPGSMADDIIADRGDR